MIRKLIRLLAIGCLLNTGSINSVAQEKRAPDEKSAQVDGTFKLLAPKGASSKVVRGAPYSATAITETIQALADGNQIIRKNQSKLYRDSEGRSRIEQTLETIGKWTADREPQISIFINDPVAGVFYSLDPRTHIAYRSVTTPKMSPGAQGDNGMGKGQKVPSAGVEAPALQKKPRDQEEIARPEKEPPGEPQLKKKPEIPLKVNPDPDRRMTESLGTKMIEGVSAEGSRTTITIPAGEIGNTLPLVIIDESWYSPELQTMLISMHRDPRSGETNYRLTSLNRSEPDRSLFDVPADYTIRDNRVPSKPTRIRREL